MALTLDLGGNDLIVNSITTGVSTTGSTSTGSSSMPTVSTINATTVSASAATVSQFHLESGSAKNIAVAASSNAMTVSISKLAGSVNTFSTSGGLTHNQSGGGVFALTLTASSGSVTIASTDQCFASVMYTPGLGQSGGNPTIGSITPSSGAVLINVVNAATGPTTSGGVTSNFSGNFVVSYAILKN